MCFSFLVVSFLVVRRFASARVSRLPLPFVSSGFSFLLACFLDESSGDEA